MRRCSSVLAMLAVIALASGARANPPPIVAVLPLNVTLAQLDDASRVTLEEDIRSIAGDRLTAMGYTVLTGENTLRILTDNGVDASKACDATCDLDAARELKAEYFLSGTVAKSEGTYVAFIRLFEPKRGQQIASVKLEGEKVRDLRAQLEKNADELFSLIPRLTPAPSAPTAAAPAPTVPAAQPPAATLSQPLTAAVPMRDPNAAQARQREGDAAFRARRYADAAAAYQEAVRLDDSLVMAHLMLGVAYGDLNRVHEAIDQWHRVLELDPGNHYAPGYIARAQAQLGVQPAAVTAVATGPAPTPVVAVEAPPPPPGVHPAVAQVGRFIVTAEAVTDGRSGLTWQRVPSQQPLGFGAAVDYCRRMRINGYGGWRVPESPEYKDLIGAFAMPALKTAFPRIDDDVVWTSIEGMPTPADGSHHWRERYDPDYQACHRGALCHVRCVRY